MFLFSTLLMVLIVFSVIGMLEQWGNWPSKISLVFLAALGVQWILFITGFYVRFHHIFDGLLWDISWISLCLFGIVMAWKEFKNNMYFAVILFAVSLLHMNFYLFTNFIGNM